MVTRGEEHLCSGINIQDWSVGTVALYVIVPDWSVGTVALKMIFLAIFLSRICIF